MLLHIFEPKLQLVSINYAAFAVHTAVPIYVSSRSVHSDFSTEKLYDMIGYTYHGFKKEMPEFSFLNT